MDYQNYRLQEESNPASMFEKLMNQERRNMEVKIAALKKNISSASAKTQITEYQKLIDTIKYIQSKGGIIEAKASEEEELQKIQDELQESQKNIEQLKESLPISQTDSEKFSKQNKETTMQCQKAEKEIEYLNSQIQATQEDYSQKKKQYAQQIQQYKEESSRQKNKLKTSIQKFQKNSQQQIEQLQNNANQKIREMSQQITLFESQLNEMNEDILGIQKIIKDCEFDEKQLINQKQPNEIGQPQETGMENNSLFNMENELFSQSMSHLPKHQNFLSPKKIPVKQHANIIKNSINFNRVAYNQLNQQQQ